MLIWLSDWWYKKSEQPSIMKLQSETSITIAQITCQDKNPYITFEYDSFKYLFSEL